MSIDKIIKMHNIINTLPPINVSTTHTYKIKLNTAIKVTLVCWVKGGSSNCSK